MIVTAALVLGVFSPVLHEAFRGVFDLPLAVALEGSAIVGLPAILVRIAYRFGALQMKMVSQRFATFRNPSVVMGRVGRQWGLTRQRLWKRMRHDFTEWALHCTHHEAQSETFPGGRQVFVRDRFGAVRRMRHGAGRGAAIE